MGEDLGRWSAAYPHVYALDFGALRRGGDYEIAVSGPSPASSPRFPIGPAARSTACRSRNALSYYQASRDGPDFVRSPLRTAPGHLNDRSAMTYLTPKVDDDGNFKGDLSPLGTRIDASGGWWDAGDYPKFVQTTSYTDGPAAHRRARLPGQMGAGSGGDFTGEVRFGARLAAPDVGRPHEHALLPGRDRLGELEDRGRPRHLAAAAGRRQLRRERPAYRYIRNRPVFRAAPPGSPISPNLAGRDAAAFALCFQVFHGRATRRSPRAACAAAGTSSPWPTRTQGHLLTVVPFDFYRRPSGATTSSWAPPSWRWPPRRRPPAGPPDELLYLREAAHWARAYIDGPNDAADTLNLYDVSGLAHFELARALAAGRQPARAWR